MGMLPEDRVARTMDLQEDIAARLEILKANAQTEQDLLPQGDKVPADAQVFKDELARITKYVEDLQAKTKIECDKYSNDVKFWAEYRTGIKEFNPWLASAEKSAADGLSKPSDLSEVQALNDKVLAFDKTCLNYLKVLDAAKAAAEKMTTHKEADEEAAGQHRHRAQLLGRQGQVRRGREPVLPGEDGVHPGRAQEHLQAEGEACGGLISGTPHPPLSYRIINVYLNVVLLYLSITNVSSLGTDTVTEARI